MLVLRAEHGGLRSFEELTGKWYGVARTPVLNEQVEVSFSPDGTGMVYELETGRGRVLVPVDLETGEQGKPIQPPLDWKSFRVGAEGGLKLETDEGWRQLDDGSWREVAAPEKEKSARSGRRDHRGWQSKDKKFEVVVRKGAVAIKGSDGEERVVIKAEEGQVFRDEPIWSPDGSRFAIWRTRDVPERTVQLVESSPKDQLQPKRSTYRYPKPGDEIDTKAPWICFVDGREAIRPDPALIENPFSCGRFAWRGDGQRGTYEYVERGFGKHRVIEVNSQSGQHRVLIGEESDAFIFVSGNSYRRDLKDGEEIIWMSERDGWKHLYLIDGRDGSVIRQLTKGEWVVRKVVEVDEENRELLIEAGGFHPGQDPYLIHYLRVGLDDGEVVALTESDGTHDRFERSGCGKYYSCRWSRVDHPPVTELRRWEDGSLVRVLAEADARKLEGTGWPLPQPFVSKDREGKFDIHGVVILPPDFDPSKKYPVVENIYAGPHGAFVPKSWRPWRMPMHEVAVHGFIVVKIDGRGTNHRSREFHQFAYKNLKDAGFPDRIAWMKAAQKKYPQMDLERVGIFGGSAGGQNAMAALLFHGDFYKAAAADCGCHDNRMDKIWWNEQWMDWPVGPHYAENSNVVHADKLQGALMLSVGELDRNVDPSSTYQVVDALMKADKDFEFLMMTGKGHGAGESRYAQRRRVDFFRRHLGGPE
ncbi:S9 family peptidase [Haloferula rosea]|uniref:S9 family peptidase n=1 Tax=Haloferula rosea TaxID=490093 RepID=UPI001907767A|nr:prolyl oligopeptidase family serine peptidase [Haloferula rosea]